MSVISIQDLKLQNINTIFEYASNYKKYKNYDNILKNKLIGFMFLEPSSRTQMSFEAAIKLLGGNTLELKNIIKYAKSNKILLIGIVSDKNSILYKSSNIKLLIPEVVESGDGIVPTSSTTAQLAFGDALSIALMKIKNFGKLDFKKFHPSGSLGNKLKTAKDIMLTKNKIPFVNENYLMRKALKILNLKKLGFLVIINNQNLNVGIFTDGDLKRLLQKKRAIENTKIKNFMTKNPFIVEENVLATEILTQMNKKKITSACVYRQGNKRKTTGVIHIHNLLKSLK